MNRYYLGIDTSNYTTSCAACDEAGKVIANIRIPLPVKDGERGLRQSDAVFSHVRNLPLAMQEIRHFLRGMDPIAVGVSTQPRRAEGSYMPCFLSGIAAAESFAVSSDIPIYRFSHQEGHIRAAVYSAGAEQLLSSRFTAFHVSGGTTDILSVSPAAEGFSVNRIGGSEDLHAGQAIDRVGVMMGLHFPCGKEMEHLSLQNHKQVPTPHVSVSGTICHLSGLENLAGKLWKETNDSALVSAYVMEFLALTMKKLTAGVDAGFPGIPVLYSGGVMSNRFLQNQLSTRNNTFFAEPEFSADNAAGIALLCKDAHERGKSL